LVPPLSLTTVLTSVSCGAMSSFPAEGHAKDIYTQKQPCASVVSAAHRSQHDSLGYCQVNSRRP